MRVNCKGEVQCLGTGKMKLSKADLNGLGDMVGL